MNKFILTLIAIAGATSLSMAQVGYWSDVGLVPRTPTIDVNTNYNNNALETGDISITSNTNVVLAWEDDIGSGGPLTDFEAVWTLFDRNGVRLTAPTTITNIPSAPCIPTAESLTDCFYRAFFRSDGSPTPGYMGDFGGKAHGNPFGDGFGFGSAGGSFACEIPELTAINLDASASGVGDFPAYQLLNNDGSRNTSLGGPDVPGILSFSDADCQADGNLRIADFEYLSNGNFVLMGESRQVADRAMTGQAAGNLAVYKVVSSSGAVVKAYTNASSSTSQGGAWHGAAAVSNGFALRFDAGGDQIRFFDNSGNPLTPNISIAAATCHPEAAGGGRGDGSGFKSNGKDAYIWACDNAAGPWVTVFNADGTVRYSRKVADIADNPDSARMDAAITEDGRAIVVWDSSNNDTNNTGLRLPQARIFDPCGRPIGPAFYLSERETPTNAVASNGDICRPRVAWRGSTIAAMWASANSPLGANLFLALRIFDAPALAPCAAAPAISISQSGTDAIISWPASYGYMTLQATPSISPTAWACISPQPAIVAAGSQNTMTVPIGTANQFFRLSQ